MAKQKSKAKAKEDFNAVVIGSGPNGLAAGITLAQFGLSVLIVEEKKTIGGGMRSGELTLPGFIHDICSAIHPLAIGSPFFQTLPLNKFGLEWIQPTVPLAHPMDDGTAIILDRSIATTSKNLGKDGSAYQTLFESLVKNWNLLSPDLLGPFHFPQHPWLMAKFALKGVQTAEHLMHKHFTEPRAKALFAGLAAHSILSLDTHLTAAFGLILGSLGHTVGWPLPRGGSQNIANALGEYFQSLGGTIWTEFPVRKLEDLPKSKLVFCDVTPSQLLSIAGNHLPETYIRKLEKYRYGPGVCKIDWALNCPIPWKAKECALAGTVHLGGTAEEIIESEKAVWEGRCSNKPYTLIAQQSLFDSTRAPEGKHTAWGYCHVPNGSNIDMTQTVEDQIERFAPGFRNCILARNTKTAIGMELYNPNNVGGDINGGVQDIYQLFTRPAGLLSPYATPVKGLYICSSSTPPGGGVHGMCGYHAAKAALLDNLI